MVRPAAPSLGLLLLALPVGPALAQQRPNVLVVLADDLGTGAVGCYGQGPWTAPTPVLDQLAASGLRFTNAHANPACSPTRAALMTGRHAFRSGVDVTLAPGAAGLSATETLLPAALVPHGYSAALIGKWHLGFRFGALTPNRFGWQHFAGSLGGALTDYYHWSKVTNGVESTCTRYATTQQVDDALAWIGAQTGPWCLLLSLSAAHTPLHAPPAHLHSQDLTGLDPQTSPVPFYRAVVEAMDREIGRLLAGIAPATLARTNVVALADNGTDVIVTYAANGTLRAKGSLYRGGSLVPLIVAGPAVRGPGRTVPALCGVVDLPPTILDLCGLAPPAPAEVDAFDGVSLLPLLQDDASAVRDDLLVELARTPWGGGYALRTGRFALLRFLSNGPQRQELYDLVADPGEHHDLLAAGAPAALAVRAQMEARLRSIRQDGWVTGIGAGCPGIAGLPVLVAETMPELGRPFVQRVAPVLPAAAMTAVLVGWSRERAGGVSLPADLGPFGVPGCRLLVSAHGVLGVPPATGLAILQVGSVPALAGMRCYTQGFVFLPGINAAGLLPTNALQCEFGI